MTAAAACSSARTPTIAKRAAPWATPRRPTIPMRSRPVIDLDTISIRAADTGDLPGVLALYAQPDFDDGHVLPIHEAERLFAHFSRYPDYTLYVAEQAGRIVGSFALLIMDNLGHLGAPSAIVEDVV